MTFDTHALRPLTGARLDGDDGLAWRIATDQGEIQIASAAPGTLRLAFIPAGAPPHRTWSLNGDPAPAPPLVALQGEGQLTLRAGNDLRLTMTFDPSAIVLQRADGTEIARDATEMGLVGMMEDGTLGWRLALAPGERIFGGGQRTGRLDKRGRRLTLWSTDPLPDHGDQTDAMYQSIAFMIGLREGRAHGIFYDSNWKALLDCGATDPDVLTYLTTGPDLVAYVFAGPTLADVLAQYTALTGRMPPAPRWSLGNQQSRWSYMSAAEVRTIAAGFREHQIPCDALYLDIDSMRGYRDFTWDPERFPDPAELIRDLRNQGFRVVPIIDPGVKVDPDYDVYRKGLRQGYYVRNPDGTPFEGWVWPGRSVWADFARHEVRAWWGEQHRSLVDIGVAGIWDDMNEPSQAGMSAPPDVTIPFGATLPAATLHGPADAPISHVAFHNAYGTEMVRATRAGLEALRPEERAFVLTRAAGAGAQRFAIVWNGDNTSQWEHIRLAIPMNLGVGLSGFPVTGIDIGGFWQDTNPELLVRFTQLGAFLPFCRNHTSKGTIHQEPWAFGDPYTSACRAAIAQRYQLLPYLVTLAQEASATGAPLMRPLAWIAPDDPESLACNDAFLLGNDLLIAPVLEEGAVTRTVTLPPGQWFSWLDGAVYDGPAQVTLPVTLQAIPVFARAGTIIPTTAVVQHTDAPPAGPLVCEVHLAAPGQRAEATIWDDDDHPQAADRGTFARYHATAEWTGDIIAMQIVQEGGQLPLRYPGVRTVVRLPPGRRAVALDAEEGAGVPFGCRYRVVRGIQGVDSST